MLVKVKSSIFIDAVQFEFSHVKSCCLRGVLKDDHGNVCRTLEMDIDAGKERLTWTGLNDLPYGKYTVELSQSEDAPENYQAKMNLVKRV